MNDAFGRSGFTVAFQPRRKFEQILAQFVS
jgi:hypothetical protein